MPWFDVTVATKDATPQEKTGRLWSQAWQVNCGSFTAALKAMFYARDEKGFVTQVNFAEAGIKPFIGQFSFNDTGTGHTGNVAADRQSVPNAQSGNPVQKVFLNQPDPNVFPLGKDGNIEDLPLKVEDPANPVITIKVSQPGSVEVVLDFGTQGNYLESVDKRLFADLSSGVNTIPWDGTNGNGVKIQPHDFPIPVTISYTQGETHFTAYDVEYLDESFVVRTQTDAGLTSPNVLFWDDSKISQSPGISPNTKTNTDLGSIARQPWSNFDFGNVNTINTWWFAYRDYESSTILMIGDYGDAPLSYGAAAHKVPESPTVYLGAIAPDKEQQMPALLDGTGDDVVGTSDEDAFSALPELIIAATTYSLNTTCVGDGAIVASWIDFDNSGTFDSSERTESTCQSGSATLSWTGISGLSLGTTYARIRIATNAVDIAEPSTAAADGEVEDYPIEVVVDYDYGDAPDDGVNFNYGVAQHVNSENSVNNALVIGEGEVGIDESQDATTWTSEWTSNASNVSWFTDNRDERNAPKQSQKANASSSSSNGNNGSATGSSSLDDVPEVTGDGEEENGLTASAFTWENNLECTGLLADGTQGTITMSETSYCLTVKANNTTNIAAQLVAWIDFNQNGVFDDPSERSVADVDASTSNDATQGNVPTGSSNEDIVLYWENLDKLSGAFNTFIRMRLTSDPEFKSNNSPDPIGVAINGEVEDTAIGVNAVGTDYGDAPASYGDASHIIELDAYMGKIIDNEAKSQNAANGGADGTGDDVLDATNHNYNDDDGVAVISALRNDATTYSVDVVVTSPSTSTANLVGWIDFDGNGTFDSDEAATIVVPQDATEDTVTLTWSPIPQGTKAGTSYMRLRLTTDTSIATGTASTSKPTGLADYGEVEDYPLTITIPPFPTDDTDVSYCSAVSTDTNFTDYRLAWTYNVPQNTLLPDHQSWPNKQFDQTVVSSAPAQTIGYGLTHTFDGDKQTVNHLSGVDQSTAENAFSYGDFIEYSFTTDTAMNPAQLFNGFAFASHNYTQNYKVDILLSDDNFTTATNILNNYTVQPASSGYAWMDSATDEALYLKPNTDYQFRVLFYGASSPDSVYWDDFHVSMGLCQDYSDAPVINYGSASHDQPLDTTYYLGDAIADAESGPRDGGDAGINADGDDIAGKTPNDDDGVTIPALIQGGTATISVVSNGANGYLQGWVDFNGNGSFDSGEQIASDVQDGGTNDIDSTSGAISFSFTVPSDATTNLTYARFRWSSTSELNATTDAKDGEVEGYNLTIKEPYSPTIPSGVCEMSYAGWSITAASGATDADHIGTAMIDSGWSFNANSLPIRPDTTPNQVGTLYIPTNTEIPELNTSASGLAAETHLAITRLTGTANTTRTVTIRDSGDEEHYIVAIKDSSGTILTRSPSSAGEHHSSSTASYDLSVTVPADGLLFIYIWTTDFNSTMKTSYPLCQDFGDAASFGDPSHEIRTGLYLGDELPDQELSSQTTSNNASGDDDDSTDDEDSITAFPELDDLDTNYSLSVEVTNQVSSSAKLVGWIDFDGNGTFDSDEATTSSATTGNVTLNWSIPTDIKAGDIFLRIRLTTDASVATGDAASSSATSAASDGEVEDYPLTIKVGGFPVSGRVYRDTDTDGENDPSEVGVTSLPVVLVKIETNTANNTCVSTRTDGSGNFTFFPVIPGKYQIYEASRESVPTPFNCDISKAKDPGSYRSTTSNVRASFTVSTSAITGQDFGDVKSPTFSPNNAKQILPGNVVFYSHKFTTPANGTVTITSANSGHKSQGWSDILYHDENCDGTLNGSEAATPITNPLIVTAADTINAVDTVCVINKVYAPANVAANDRYIQKITAAFDYGNTFAGTLDLTVQDITTAQQIQTPTLPATPEVVAAPAVPAQPAVPATSTIPEQPAVPATSVTPAQPAVPATPSTPYIPEIAEVPAQDSVAATPVTPEVGPSRLELRKTVKNISQAPFTEASTINSAAPGDTLEYRIYYSNSGTGPITDLVINDSVPLYTTMKGSASCGITLANMGCTTSAFGLDDDLKWTLTGTLTGGSGSSVSYQVLIDK
ncbi:GEVED domain-containing protein [Leucothrix arctica]|nr:GEVED domain-containing protein [Leucothrix arctica]